MGVVVAGPHMADRAVTERPDDLRVRDPGTNWLGFVVPEPWAYEGGIRREPVLDADQRPMRVVRYVGWRHCLRLSASPLVRGRQAHPHLRLVQGDALFLRIRHAQRESGPAWRCAEFVHRAVPSETVGRKSNGASSGEVTLLSPDAAFSALHLAVRGVVANRSVSAPRAVWTGLPAPAQPILSLYRHESG
jgi:hypothetical protein